MSGAKETQDAMTSRQTDPRTIRERLTLTVPAAKATAPNTLADKLMLVGILDLKSLDAVETLVESRIKKIRQDKSRAKDRRAALIVRLRAAHACSKAAEPGFVQLPSTGARKWRCDGCLATVTLKKGA
jgi:hypothetical protein